MSQDDDEDAGRNNTDPIAARDGYIELIRRTKDYKGESLRTLAERTGIGKSRLGLLLHQNPTRRPEMGLTELKILFNALEIDTFAAVICIEAFGDSRVLDKSNYRSVIALLCVVFRCLPVELVEAMDSVDHIEGSDVRPEWAIGLQRAVVRRIIREIRKIAAAKHVDWDKDF